MPRYLLTPSLHDSWRFYHLMESKEKSDFLTTLRKEPITDPDSLANINAGKAFEEDVMKVANEGMDFTFAYEDYRTACVVEIANIVRGGLWQERVMFSKRISGMDFLIYGRTDVIKRDFIYDIKRTKSYEIGKYTNSIQHTVYMVGSGIKKFAYLASDEKTVYREDYRLDDDMIDYMNSELEGLVNGIFGDDEFREAYIANWEADKPKVAA